MPQHLRIEVEGRLAGRLTTYNKGRGIAQYDVTLCVPELQTDFFLSDVDTGVQSQPQDQKARAKDWQDDFTHARRCIAGAFASSDEFLKRLKENGTPEHAKLRPIMMRLMTNKFDRGFIQVEPSDNELVNVKVVIGSGGNRVLDAFPKEAWRRTWKGIDAAGATSQTERAFEIIGCIGCKLLQKLSEQACR